MIKIKRWVCNLFIFSLFITFTSLSGISSAKAQENSVDARTGERIERERRDAGEHANLRDEIERCADYSTRQDRLLCFDNISHSLGFLSKDELKAREEVIEELGFWDVTISKNNAGEETIFLKNTSVEFADIPDINQKKAILVIKCQSGRTEAYLDWLSYIPVYSTLNRDIHPLFYKFENGDKINANWQMSSDQHALFVPDPIRFVRDVRKNDSLQIEMSPSGKQARKLLFDLSEADKAIGILVRRCYN